MSIVDTTFTTKLKQYVEPLEYFFGHRDLGIYDSEYVYECSNGYDADFAQRWDCDYGISYLWMPTEGTSLLYDVS